MLIVRAVGHRDAVETTRADCKSQGSMASDPQSQWLFEEPVLTSPFIR